MSVNVFNRCWARVILESLVRHGVSQFCIAPGSRSTPLTLEAVELQNQNRAICHTHFEERGLGFFALGLAKSRQECVAVIVTSGTAAANLYPAIIEARQTNVNLVILTADRPIELLECGANQAILQENMFANYPIANVNLPRPTPELPANWLLSYLDQAYQKQAKTSGVIHINIPFSEPLYGADEEKIKQHNWLISIQSWLTQHKREVWIDHPVRKYDVELHTNWEDWRTKKGIILIGRLSKAESEGLAQWANAMGWIVITDVQSNISSVLPYADIWLGNKTVLKKLLEADLVIQFGGGFVSKRVNRFLQAYQGEYWIIAETEKNLDPYHHKHTHFNMNVMSWLQMHPPLRQKVWLLEPLALSKFCDDFIMKKLGSALNEVSLAYNIDKILPNKCDLFLGNSLFVRLADAFAHLPDDCRVFTNRGASGIDGLIATAAGISFSSNRPLIAILGDTSLLYDLNSLALLQKVVQPVIVFVINNNGGAIFDMLPISEDVKEKYYQMPHQLEFAQAAALFGLKYALPRTWPDLNSALRQAYKQRGATLIELKVPPTSASRFYRYILDEIANAVIGDENENETEVEVDTIIS